MTTRCVRLPVSVSGSRLPAAGSPATGDRDRPPAADRRPHRSRAHRQPETGDRLDRDCRPARQTGKPNPAIPLEGHRHALPHVRPRSRKPETSVSDVARSPWVLGASDNMGVWLVFGLRCVLSMGTSWGEKV